MTPPRPELCSRQENYGQNRNQFAKPGFAKRGLRYGADGLLRIDVSELAPITTSGTTSAT
jgi:hypothetical protein